jgi:hypothetical protein
VKGRIVALSADAAVESFQEVSCFVVFRQWKIISGICGSTHGLRLLHKFQQIDADRETKSKIMSDKIYY